jgi:hypothetical protein
MRSPASTDPHLNPSQLEPNAGERTDTYVQPDESMDINAASFIEGDGLKLRDLSSESQRG